MTYQVSRKADRRAMASELAQVITDAGYAAHIEYEQADGFSDRRVKVTPLGLPHGLGLLLELEPMRGLSAELGTAGLLHWYMHGAEAAGGSIRIAFTTSIRSTAPRQPIMSMILRG